jgi:hypothetical protein
MTGEPNNMRTNARMVRVVSLIFVFGIQEAWRQRADNTMQNIVEGMENQPQELDTNGNPVMKLGRAGPTNYIDVPKVEIVE